MAAEDIAEIWYKNYWSIDHSIFSKKREILWNLMILGILLNSNTDYENILYCSSSWWIIIFFVNYDLKYGRDHQSTKSKHSKLLQLINCDKV